MISIFVGLCQSQMCLCVYTDKDPLMSKSHTKSFVGYCFNVPPVHLLYNHYCILFVQHIHQLAKSKRARIPAVALYS